MLRVRPRPAKDALAAILLARILLAPALLATAPARLPPDGSLCRAAIAGAEAGTRIPDAFLNAIGRVESGRNMPGAGFAPWPWTINAAGTGHFYASKAEAISAARSFLAAGVKSIDVGCLQVNLMYHPDAFASLDEAFDPASNAAYAARLLQILFAQQGSWPRAAAAYHSQTPALGQDYQAKVLAAWALPDRPDEAATPSQPPARAQPGPPFAAIPPLPGSPFAGGQFFAGGPVLGFARSLRLPGAAARPPSGRALAAYRTFPVRLAATAPMALRPRLK